VLHKMSVTVLIYMDKKLVDDKLELVPQKQLLKWIFTNFNVLCKMYFFSYTP